MKPLVAEFVLAKRERLNPSANVSPEYDDNLLILVLRLIAGPEQMLDRNVTLRVGLSRFVDALPVEVRKRMWEVLDSEFHVLHGEGWAEKN